MPCLHCTTMRPEAQRVYPRLCLVRSKTSEAGKPPVSPHKVLRSGAAEKEGIRGSHLAAEAKNIEHAAGGSHAPRCL